MQVLFTTQLVSHDRTAAPGLNLGPDCLLQEWLHAGRFANYSTVCVDTNRFCNDCRQKAEAAAFTIMWIP